MFSGIGDDLPREERRRIIDESLSETRAQGLEPSQRSKDLAGLWVEGKIPFVEAARGIYQEAVREQVAKLERRYFNEQ